MNGVLTLERISVIIPNYNHCNNLQKRNIAALNVPVPGHLTNEKSSTVFLSNTK